MVYPKSFNLRTLAATFACICASAPSAWAAEKMIGQLVCQQIGPASPPEKLTDRENHAISIARANCVEQMEPAKGEVIADEAIWEWNGATGTLFSQHGIGRIADSLEVYKGLDGKIELTMSNGEVTGYRGEGHLRDTIAVGLLAPYSGKTVSWTIKSTGPSSYVVDYMAE